MSRTNAAESLPSTRGGQPLADRRRKRLVFVQPAPYFYPWYPPNYTALMSWVHAHHPSWEPVFFGMAPWPADRLALEDRSKWEHPWRQGRFAAAFWGTDQTAPDFAEGPSSFDQWLTREAQRVLLLEPDLVGFSSSLSDWMYGLPLLAKLRSLDPGCRILGGGPHLTLICQLALDHGFRRVQRVLSHLFEGIVLGEGEQSLSCVLRAVETGSDWSNVPELCVRAGDGLSRPRRSIEPLSLDALPAPHFELFGAPGASYSTPTLETSRGCTSHCSFCSVRSFWPGFRVKSAQKMKTDIDHYLTSFPARPAVRFVDTTLHPGLPGIRELFEYVHACGGIPWSSFVRIADLDEKSLDLFARSGCERLLFGVETGDDGLLSVLGKKHTCADAERAVAGCLARGITPVPSVMIGLPEETPETAAATLDLAERLARVHGCGEIIVEEFLPVPGSPYVDSGRIALSRILREEAGPGAMAIAPHVWFEPPCVPWRTGAYRRARTFARRVDFFPTQDLRLA